MTKNIIHKCDFCGETELIPDSAMINTLSQILPDNFTMQLAFIVGTNTNYILGEVKNPPLCFICKNCGHKKIIYDYAKNTAKAYIYSKEQKRKEKTDE